MSGETRVYGKIRDIIERRGGSMVWHRSGYRYGAWEISLDGKRVVVEAMGVQSFPALDRFYKSSQEVAVPKTWDDYEDELVDGAEEQLIAWIRLTADRQQS
jgi:hypothetical protein